MTDVCAVVLNYFAAEKTANCIRSVSFQPLQRIIVVDNSADEQEAKRLAEALDRVMLDAGTELKISANSQNLGFARAVNKAVAEDSASASSVPYYLLLNNDAIAEPNLVAELVRKANEDPCIGLIAPRVDQDDLALVKRQYYRFWGHVADGKGNRAAVPFLNGSCLLVNPQLLAGTRMFDEDFFMYGEDVWLSWHCLRSGFELAVVDTTGINHEGTGSSRHGGIFYEYYTARGHVLLGTKMLRSRLELPVMFAGRIAYLAFRALRRAVRYKSMAPIAAYFMCWFGLEVRPPVRKSLSEDAFS